MYEHLPRHLLLGENVEVKEINLKEVKGVKVG